MNAEIDVRHVLPLVRVPTLVLHRTADRCLLVEEGRYVASLIPGARFVEFPGDDHLPFVGDQEAMLKEIEAFVHTAPRERADRVLATVLVARAAAVTARDSGLEQEIRQEIGWFRGRDLALEPDGFVAAFDGPARAIACAHAIVRVLRRHGTAGAFGLHTGECDSAQDGRLVGIAFDLARSVAALAAPGEVLVTRTVTDLVAGSGLTFTDRGSHLLVPERPAWHLFAAVEQRAARQVGD